LSVAAVSRTPSPGPRVRRRSGSPAPRRPPMPAVAPAAPPVFKTPEGRSEYLEAYDAVLREWPVPYQELDLATRAGATHVIASGVEDGPPLLLLPSFGGSATLWRPNAAALGRRF